MSDTTLVRELMLPLGEYAMVDEGGTLTDALEALARSQARVRPGRKPHRAVLVRRGDEMIVGRLGYHEILSALLPEQESSFYEEALRRGGLSPDIIQTSVANLDLLGQDLPSLCERAGHIRIRELSLPEPEVVAIGASDRELVAAFVRHKEQNLLVTEGEDVIGIVRISDLFDSVEQLALGRPGTECMGGEGE